MNQSRQNQSRIGVGIIGSAIMFSGLLLGGTICLSGCGSDQGTGMIEGAGENPAKKADAQDSMKAYMQSMKTKGMRPGMKTSAK
jgi:hypothetical protein